MGTVNIRVDDRLIHGQTILAWCPKYGVKEIIAIDNVSAANPVLKSIITMGVPKEYKTHVVTSEEAIDLIKKDSDVNRLVIVKYPSVLEEIKEVINESTEIVLGNLAKRDDSVYNISGATGIFFLSEIDVNNLNVLVDEGIKIKFQQLPNTPETSWKDFYSNK